MHKRVVSDTGPLLHLYEAGLLDILKLTGDIFIPKAVHNELVFLLGDWKQPSWLNQVSLNAEYAAKARDWEKVGLLDWGESEAIALARMIHADWFLTDDATARLMATELGLEVHGSLGVVLWCAAVGYLDRESSEAALQALAASSLWISKRVLSKAHEALDEMFPERRP